MSVVAVTPVFAPRAGLAAPGQDAPDGGGGDDTGGASPGPIDVDLLRASGPAGGIVASLGQMDTDIRTQVTAVVTARRAAASAAAALAAADAAVAETQQEIDDLADQGGEVVVDAFIDPPVENVFETLSDGSLADATVRQTILNGQADARASVLDRLEAARDELIEVKAQQDEAAAASRDRSEEAAAALDDLVASQSAEALFVLAVQDRVEEGLAEADAVATLDPEAARALRAREGEIADTIAGIVADRERIEQEQAFYSALADAAEQAAVEEQAAAQPAGPATTLGPASGSLASVPCPAGGSITVDSSLASNLGAMMSAAAADGLNLCGNGYRDPAAQIAVRRANCGTSDYDIYEAPSSSCSPPTAKPGTSQHELGLAVDFTCNGGGAMGRSTPCFPWLQSNAASYGLYNLPSEPWHWSNDGT